MRPEFRRFPDPGFTLTSTASCNYTRYRSNDMNDLITQLRKSYTADSYQSAMRLIQDQFEQDQPYICLYWRSAVLLSRETFTDVRDVRELEMLRGIENYGELTPYKKNRLTTVLSLCP